MSDVSLCRVAVGGGDSLLALEMPVDLRRLHVEDLDLRRLLLLFEAEREFARLL